MTHHVVFFETRGIQVRLLALPKNAHKVASLVGLLVNLLVLLQVASARKLLAALFTLERLLACVDPLVANQVRYLTESLGATLMLALEWLELVMHSGVLLQGRVLSKRLITH
jgi:hypothetical protein